MHFEMVESHQFERVTEMLNEDEHGTTDEKKKE